MKYLIIFILFISSCTSHEECVEHIRNVKKTDMSCINVVARTVCIMDNEPNSLYTCYQLTSYPSVDVYSLEKVEGSKP